MKRVLSLSLFVLASVWAMAAPRPLVITSSRKLSPRILTIPSGALDQPAIIIKGSNIDVDLTGVELRGGPMSADPDQRKGLGVLIQGDHITVRGLKVRGYQVGVLARKCTALNLYGIDASYNWKQRLKSGLDKEDLDDWMSYHQNEKDEWLRYGAAISLNDVEGFEVKRCRATGGQCGLMMTRCSGGLIWNNDFSFLSGLGIGMYRTSGCRVMHNAIDYCVRGYSHGVYNRGQDSAGILVFEQCHRNVFAYNSVTHGGDGFFLWAGQSTMDTAQGGCNDNLVYGNDFSFAPTNGIEATFSKNLFVNNRIEGCWHGVWGGYSYDTLIAGNDFSENEEGIAIEHGQSNVIDSNRFSNDKTAIHLWANDSQDPDWGYPKHRDTRSMGSWIKGNVIFAPLALRLRRTTGLEVRDNYFAGPVLKMDDDKVEARFDSNAYLSPASMPPATMMIGGPKLATAPAPVEWTPLGPEGAPWAALQPKPLTGGNWPTKNPAIRADRSSILVDEWGPVDYRSPVLWPKLVDAEPGKQAADEWWQTVGPRGTWRVVKVSKGVHVSPLRGAIGDPIAIKFDQPRPNDVDVQLAFTGVATTDVRGVWHPARKALRFGHREFRMPIDWQVKWVNWTEATDPRKAPEAFEKLFDHPVATAKKTELNENWWRSPAKGVNENQFGTAAEGSFTVQPGNYVLSVTADDGVRVWLDGTLVIDEWHYQGPTTFTVKAKLGGQHHLKVRHFEIDGFSCLKVALARATP